MFSLLFYYLLFLITIQTWWVFLSCVLFCPSTYLLCAQHWGWPWCCICECSGSTRSASGSPHPLLHFDVRRQSKSPTGWTQQMVSSCPGPVETITNQTMQLCIKIQDSQASTNMIKGSGNSTLRTGKLQVGFKPNSIESNFQKCDESLFLAGLSVIQQRYIL